MSLHPPRCPACGGYLLPCSETATGIHPKRFRVQRTTGEIVTVDVPDTPHYEVTIEGKDDQGDMYWREEIVRARSAEQARLAALGLLAHGERVFGASRVGLDVVAVMTLRRAEADEREAAR